MQCKFWYAAMALTRENPHMIQNLDTKFENIEWIGPFIKVPSFPAEFVKLEGINCLKNQKFGLINTQLNI